MAKISLPISFKQENLFDCDFLKEEEYELPMENESNFLFVKSEYFGMNNVRLNDDPFCASQGPSFTSTPIKSESVDNNRRNNHRSLAASRGEFFMSELVNYEDLGDDIIKRSVHVPRGSYLISRPVNHKEGDKIGNDISLCPPKGPVLLSRPITFEKPLDELDPLIQEDTTEVLPSLIYEKPFQCGYCTRTYKRKDHLALHLRTHTGEKPFKCRQCDAAFAYRSVLKHHELVHSGKKPFECEFCGAGFTKKFNLKSHLSRIHSKGVHHEPMERKFKCNSCESKFVRKSALKVHEQTHSSDKPFECTSCKKRYKYKQVLNKHLQTHNVSDSSKEKCDIC